MVILFLFRKVGSILIRISLLTAVHDYTDDSICKKS